MILQVLYLLVLCEMGPAPCPGPFFRDGDKPQDFTRPREKCLATARAVEVDGLERWRGAQKR